MLSFKDSALIEYKKTQVTIPLFKPEHERMYRLFLDTFGQEARPYMYNETTVWIENFKFESVGGNEFVAYINPSNIPNCWHLLGTCNSLETFGKLLYEAG